MTDQERAREEEAAWLYRQVVESNYLQAYRDLLTLRQQVADLEKERAVLYYTIVALQSSVTEGT